MHPSKVRKLLPSFAMEMGRSVDEVEAVTNFFYKNLRSNLSGLTFPTIHIPNLGNFYIKERALDEEMKRMTIYMETLSDDDIKQYGVKRDIKNRLSLMQSIKDALNEERKRRVSVIQKRYGTKEQHNQNLEEQGSDTEGSDQ